MMSLEGLLAFIAKNAKCHIIFSESKREALCIIWLLRLQQLGDLCGSASSAQQNSRLWTNAA